jgi:hypothetical protein
MVAILQRLAEWNTQMLDDNPIKVLKGIVTDAENLLLELDLDLLPPKVPTPVVAPATEPASEPSEGTSEPDKTPQPASR